MSEPQDQNAEAPKKIAPEQVEILGAGTHAKHVDQGPRNEGIKIIQSGPMGLFAIPLAIVLLPVLLIGLFFLMFLAVFFGRSVFKVIKFKR